jgi:transcription factor TFIIIB component B''
MRGAQWCKEETKSFLAALRQCGTDFTLLQALFPTRTRRQMKLKFCREEKIRPELIKAILNMSSPLDIDAFDEYFENHDSRR